MMKFVDSTPAANRRSTVYFEDDLGRRWAASLFLSDDGLDIDVQAPVDFSKDNEADITRVKELRAIIEERLKEAVTKYIDEPVNKAREAMKRGTP